MNKNIDFAIRLNDSATKTLDELSKQLIAVSAAMLIFLVALNNFIKDNPEMLIHPKYSWLSFLVSIFCGVCFHLVFARRHIVDGNKIVGQRGDIPNRSPSEPILSSSPWALEHFLRKAQTSTFLLGLTMTGIGLVFS
jgi:hypothetical protein